MTQETKELKMYIFINTDLGMTPGKIYSQLIHLTRQMTSEIIRLGYEVSPTPKECILYKQWENKPTTIVLKANTLQFEELLKIKGVKTVIDSGKTTQVESGTLTVLGFLPGENIGDVDKFKLF
jgi:peptidyl-tRNA hydrolase